LDENRKNTTFDWDDVRAINAETARTSKEKIEEHNKKVREVVNEFYETFDKGAKIDRTTILSSFLKQVFMPMTFLIRTEKKDSTLPFL
jgi:glutamyl-tRNA reductase